MPGKRIRSCLKDEVSTNDVAALLRMDVRSVQSMVKAGILPRLRRGCFILQQVVFAYVDHLRKTLPNNAEEAKLLRAKLRKAEADGERAELELKLFKSQLHTSDAVMFIWSTRIGASRKRLLAIPNRLAPHLVGETDRTKIYGHLQREIESALEDVANLSEKDFAKQNRAFLAKHRSNGE